MKKIMSLFFVINCALVAMNEEEKKTKTIRTCVRLLQLQQKIDKQQEEASGKTVVSFDKFCMDEIINKAKNPYYQFLTPDIVNYLRKNEFINERDMMDDVVREAILKSIPK